MTGRGAFDAYAITSRFGPHVTLQAGVVHAGSHWTTTTRGSAKAASIRRVGHAGVTVGEDRTWRVIGGDATVLDPTHLSTIAAEPVASALASGAVLRLGLAQLDQLRGYAEAGSQVPASFLPAGRVLLVIDVADEMRLDGDEVVGAGGRWDGDGVAVEPERWPNRQWRPDAALADVPDAIAELARQARPGWLGLETGAGAVALPGSWDPVEGLFRVGRGALTLMDTPLPGSICVTLDDSDSRRPDEKLGVMLRGTGAVVDVDATAALVALEIDRVTHWSGFVSATSGEVA